MAPDNAKTVEQAINDLERRLSTYARKARNSNRIFLIVGLILALLVFTYLTIMLGMVGKHIQDPGTLAALVTSRVTAMYPQALADLERNVKENAGTWIGQGADQLLAALPEMRQKLEGQAVDYAVTEARVAVQGQLDKIVKDMLAQENKEKLEPLIKQASDPDGAKALEEELQTLFGDALGLMVKDELEPYNAKLRDAAAKLKRLRTAPDLSDTEKDERKWVASFVEWLAQTVKGVAKQPVLTITQ